MIPPPLSPSVLRRTAGDQSLLSSVPQTAGKGGRREREGSCTSPGCTRGTRLISPRSQLLFARNSPSPHPCPNSPPIASREKKVAAFARHRGGSGTGGTKSQFGPRGRGPYCTYSRTAQLILCSIVFSGSPALPASEEGFQPMPSVTIRPAGDSHLPSANTCISR